MPDLTERQKELLKTIIEKYIETAEPIGSETIEKESSLGISPATIRNEMVKLTSLGYLKQPHTSAGRIPTSMAFKFYVAELMKAKELSVKDEVAIKESLWDYRYEFDKLLRQATRALAEQTRSMALATTQEGETYSSGLANILDMPEFYDIDLTKSVLLLPDRFDLIREIFFERAQGVEPINILLGDELGYEYLSPCGFVFTRFSAGTRHQGVIGVVGPCRLNYPVVIPAVRYIGDLINEVSASW
jgi:heat-inducible transcriptional repressor